MASDPNSSRHLLTVLHAAERTGPPLLALRFLRWLREQRPSWQLSTLFLDADGPLLDDFAELGPALFEPPVDRDEQRLPWLANGIRERRLSRTLTRLGPLDAAHVHCAGSMRAVPMLPRAPVLCHVHELSVGQDFHLGKVAAAQLPRATRYVAVSDAVRDELLGRFDIDPSLVERQWGFVDAESLPEPGPFPLPLPSGSIVVVGSGVRHWRKGPELFVRVAQRTRQLHPQHHWEFVWIGGSDVGGLEHRMGDAGPDAHVHFVEHQAEPLRWIGAADVFLLSAREDAFPLVCVEAAALGRPIVSFDSGGTPELIRAAQCGAVVGFPDVDGVADALAGLAADPARRERMGCSGADFARQHLVLSEAGPALLHTIETTMALR